VCGTFFGEDDQVTALSPIVLFVYRRPEHTRATIAALAACPEASRSDLFVYSDGPRSDEQKESVQETRSIVQSAKGFRSINMVERPANIGLFQNVVLGLHHVFSSENCAIVLEDDIEVFPDFLAYMNEGLDHYSRNPQVFSVTGFLYPVELTHRDLDSFLFPRFCCWGWGTWATRWKQIPWEVPSRSSFLGSPDSFWAFWRASNDLPEIMLDLIDKMNDSWSILFNYWQVLHEGFCAYPARSHARNIGFDGSGTHAGRDEKFQVADDSSSRTARESSSFRFADTYDSGFSEPLRRYFQNSIRRRARNLVRYGRFF
jgi:hypothetical protein